MATNKMLLQKNEVANNKEFSVAISDVSAFSVIDYCRTNRTM